MKFINDFWSTLIVVVVVVLLASFIVYNSNKNQREIIDAVKQSQQARQAAINETLEKIRQQMKDDQKWQNAVQSLEQK